jgi:hypothetical protein
MTLKEEKGFSSHNDGSEAREGVWGLDSGMGLGSLIVP